MRKRFFLGTLSFFIITISIFAFNKRETLNNKHEITISNLDKKSRIKRLPPSASISGTTEVCKDASEPEITFTGSNSTPPYTFTYNLNGGANQTIISTGNTAKINVNTSIPGTFVYKLISVESNSEVVNINKTATVIVSEPSVDFTFNNDDTCSGTSIQFNSTVTGNSPYTYSWSFGGGETSNKSNPAHIFTSLGCGIQTSNITLTVTDKYGCSNSITKVISIKQKPHLAFIDIDATANFTNPFDNCGNNTSNPSYTINVGNNSNSTSCISSYDIDWGDGSSETNVTFPLSHTYLQLGSYNMVISANGDNCDNKITYLVKNSSNPTGAIVNPGNTVNLCIPVAPIEFAIGSWGTNPPDTNYFVSYGDGETESYTQAELEASIYYDAANPSNSQNFPIPHTYTETNCPNGSYTVYLDVSTSCGASNLTAGPIIILKKPEVSFDAPPLGCLNTLIQFDNTSTQGYNQNCNTNEGYFWDFGDGNTSTLRDPTHTYTSSGTYTVSLYAQNFCGTTETVTKDICIEPQLVPSFTLGINNGCSPLDVQTTNTTDLSEGCGGETYLWEVTYTSNFCGTAPEVWNFTNGTDENSTAPSINFVTAGTYTLTLTTTNSCGSNSISETLEVKQPPTATLNTIADFCDTASINPMATIDSCSPSSETITYSWSFPDGNPTTANTLDPGTIVYSTPGDYQITFSVTNSCSTTTVNESFSVNPIPTITNTNLTQTICSGTDTSEIILTSDLPNTTYTWSASSPAGISGFTTTGNTSTIPIQTIFNSNPTSEDVTYVITPTTNGCDGNSINIAITVDPAPSFTSQPQAETICLNGVLNPLSVTVNGAGTPSYQWYRNTINSNTGGTIITGETTPTYTPPTNAIGVIYYYCIVAFPSGIGCNEITSDTARIEIVDGIQIDNQPLITQSICNGGDINSALSVTHSGGTGNIAYQWYSNTTNSNTGGIIIAGATNITYTPPTFTTSGDYYYYVIISLSGNGCGDITSDTAEVIVVDDPVVTNQPITSQELCQGIVSQDIEVGVNGGLGAIYNYQWYSNTVNSNTGGTIITGATSIIFTPPTATVGNVYYYCIITQPDPGCSVISDTSLVTVNAAPLFTTQPVSETICFGDSLNTLSTTYVNGVGTPTYQWYVNTTDDTLTGTSIIGETNSTFSPPSTSIGTVYYYNIITFSSGGCTEIISQTAEITINETPNISSSALTICSGVMFQIIPDSSTGDIVPLGTFYTWSTPTINPMGSITGASNENVPQSAISQTLTNSTTTPAIVTYTVTPISGICTGSDFTITITVNPSISITTNQTDSLCYIANNGYLDISITGGVPFSTGNPYQISWTGPNGFTNTNGDISNLQPGVYNLAINDDGGCPFTDTFTILEPDELIFSTVNFNPETISCFGADDGTIGIDISGGTIPYQYTWLKDGLIYTNTEDLLDLGPGDYQIAVTDANNCTPIVQNFSIIEPALLQVSLINHVDVICFGDATGAINIDVTGGRLIEISTGVFDYNYSWTGPNGFTTNSQNLTNLIAGTYNLTVTDKSGCIDTFEVVLIQSDEIIIDFTTTDIECYGDNNASITIDNISGGNPPYTIQWSNLGSGLVQNNLSAGNYTITVTDITNCIQIVNHTIDESPIFSVAPIVNQVSCFGENDASISLNLVGGINPVTLIWNDDAIAGVERNNIGPGTYTVTITDGTPCIITETFIIIEPDALIISGNSTDALDCNDANTGSINLIVTGGTLPLSYAWSNGSNTEDLTNIPPGNYSVVVTDANNCDITSDWVINRFDPLTIDVETTTDANCNTREINQTFIARVAGGVPPYQINWSSGIVSGVNNEIMNTTQDGLITIDVIDSLGCTVSFSYNVDIPILGDPNFSVTSGAFNTFGFHSIQDPIQFTNIATGDYASIFWDFGDGNFSSEENPEHTYINEGTYTILQTVTYPFGCVYTKQISLTIQKGYSLIMPNAFTPNGDLLNDYFVPKSIALSAITFNVYDTWGSLIYSETGDSIKGWNGKINDADAENGNYYYTLTANTFYGETIKRDGAFVSIK